MNNPNALPAIAPVLLLLCVVVAIHRVHQVAAGEMTMTDADLLVVTALAVTTIDVALHHAITTTIESNAGVVATARHLNAVDLRQWTMAMVHHVVDATKKEDTMLVVLQVLVVVLVAVATKSLMATDMVVADLHTAVVHPAQDAVALVLAVADPHTHLRMAMRGAVEVPTGKLLPS